MCDEIIAILDDKVADPFVRKCSYKGRWKVMIGGDCIERLCKRHKDKQQRILAEGNPNAVYFEEDINA